MKTNIALAAMVLFCAVVSCKTKQKATGTTSAGAPTVVYKTKADYSRYVPVTLSADKKEIVAYPAPKDVYYQGQLAYPVQLENGYLLDNRGVGLNTAFLNISYEDYAKLPAPPTLNELYKRILEKDPFIEIYDLGDRSRFKNATEQINNIIKKGGLKKFTKIK